MNAGHVSVPVTVDLHPDVHRRLQHADPGLRRCREELTASLSRLVAELGLPTEPAVSLAEDPNAEFPIAVTIGGSPSWSARRVAAQPLYWAGAAGLPMGPASGLPGILMSIPGPGAARVLAAWVTEAVRRDAELLISPAVTGLWAAGAGLPAGWDPAAVLRQLLRLGLPPGTGAEVAAALEEHPASSAAGLEAAVAARAATSWEILVPPGSLREITADGLEKPDRFRQLRESFAANTGVRLPQAALAGDTSLPTDAMLFRVFGVTGPLVLRRTATAQAPTDGALADGAAAAAWTAASSTPTNGETPAASGLGDLIAAGLRMLALDCIEALVTTTSTAVELARLGAGYPKLQGLTSAIGLDTVTRLLRALAAEGVNVQNLPLVLQAALDCHERSGAAIDDAELLHQVRVRLGQTITRAAAGGADLLEVSRVPGEMEDLSSPDAVPRLMAFVARVMAPGQHRGRVLVTSPRTRAAVRVAVATVYPALPVLGEDELAGAPQAGAAQATA